ncbi:MAG: hypothetical protein VYD41_01185 [Candidatus Thermoplasmatota archaeon]|nr:hypothetical protein [Candidatus Thermoplasmatota archaeon]
MPSDSTKGFALIACSIVLLSFSLEMMQNHEDAETEYEKECDLQYRAMNGNVSSPDWGLCSELDEARSRKATSFMASLAAFVLTGLMGTVMLLPGDENQR